MIILTILTQVGGVLYILIFVLSKRYRLNNFKSGFLFGSAYLTLTFVILPVLAKFFGREQLPLSGNLQPKSVVTLLLNRHYVNPELKKELISIANEVNGRFEGTKTLYLDANFPFFDGFPLLPHLSHNDGKKIDLAFYYTEEGEFTNTTPAWLGYGYFEGPEEGEEDYPKKCKESGRWQYGLLSILGPGSTKMELDKKRTRYLLKRLAQSGTTSKIFIEPHLKKRWKLQRFENIRFHGCHAVRHDDHIHWQIN